MFNKTDKKMSLKEKLQQINKTAISKQNDAEKIKNNWISKIENLYSQTKEWFDPYLKEGLFSENKKKKFIHEEDIGHYEVTQLEYEFGKYSLIFEPMGTNIIGAFGRIDVYLTGKKSDKYMLVLLGDDFKSANWFIASFQNKSNKFEFTKSHFEQIIENWIDQS